MARVRRPRRCPRRAACGALHHLDQRPGSVGQNQRVGAQANGEQIAFSVGRRDQRGLVKRLGGVDHQLAAQVAIEGLKVLLVIGPVAAELNNVGGIVGRKLRIDDLEVVSRAAVGLADHFDFRIGLLEQLDHLQGPASAVVITPPTHANLGRAARVHGQAVGARRDGGKLNFDNPGLLNNLSLDHNLGLDNDFGGRRNSRLCARYEHRREQHHK